MVPNSETKNQGLKGPQWDQNHNFASQDQDRDQDIKTESWDVSWPRCESWELHHCTLATANVVAVNFSLMSLLQAHLIVLK